MKQTRQAAISFIFLTILLDVIGFGIIIPVIPSILKEFTGGDLTTASRYGGWLLFSFSLVQFFSSPVLGNLSDRFGRRRVLLISLLGFGLDYLFLAFAPGMTWLFIGRIIAGITGGSITTATAYIADISTPENRGKNFGMVGAAFGLGFIIGPVLGGWLGEIGPRIPFLAAAGLSFMNFLYGYFILPESLSEENRRPFEWKRANPFSSLVRMGGSGIVGGFTFAIFFLHMASHSVQSTWSYFTMGEFGWSSAQVGNSLGVVGLLVALVQGLLIGKANRWLGVKKSVFIGLSLSAFGLLVFSFAFQPWILYAGLIPYCISGIAGPSLQAYLSSKISPSEQGELQGFMTSIISLSAIIGPPLMTNLYAGFSTSNGILMFPGAAFFLGMIFALISLFICVRNFR
jgi:DHA1 family tetracycline resistance protein-like MFS transporter